MTHSVNGRFANAEVTATLSADGGGWTPNGGGGSPLLVIGFKAGQSARGQLGIGEEVCQTLQRQMSALEPTVCICGR